MTAHYDDNGASFQPIDHTPSRPVYRIIGLCLALACFIAVASCAAEAVAA